MNTREEGYYWVKVYSSDSWTIAHFLNYKWELSYCDRKFLDSDFAEINKTRILPPQN